ncbi:hypothetical protein [Altibacter lentus]|uniref:hypothetical protein n=1 Tax=Altibacter lentus TaxID=1223410 RepID=UPI00054D7B5A|nr:hypothetical protein [Altibacter lentus]
MKKLVLIAVLLVIFSCKNDDNDPCNPAVDFTSLEMEYGCIDTEYQTDINLSNDFVVIKSQTQFNTLVTGNCQPTIDFSKYNLIIGKQSLPSGNDSIDYTIVKDCDSNDIEMNVTFNQNSTTEAPNLTFHALIPTLQNNQNVLVSIHIN